MIKSLHVFFHLILPKLLCNRYQDWPHFADGETEARVGILAQVPTTSKCQSLTESQVSGTKIIAIHHFVTNIDVCKTLRSMLSVEDLRKGGSSWERFPRGGSV